MIATIKDRVVSTPVQCPANSGPRRRILDSRTLRASNLDAAERPLLPDVGPEMYLSPEYQSADLDLLKDYGFISMHMESLL